ncbi:MAG TPA: branched-chain-amino-acid transaminase [Methanothrix sp.]|jgi:branched-chain amino acid aminotransferase|nr:branched-chain-amino-acid transaminase [Methanothrix sp.]HOV82862.1 branched-chain-amino-acid transaminase [Methanothrix sp.]HPC89662.1 branched-chain-amino-acid transaminase [Methanothrix sp.]HQI67990.1 branched-chain-amino-acid transaminase [Methanothrix sp.]HRS84924.1 branched-chain-amino-acid transaminase [Methanothrix sp.]
MSLIYLNGRFVPEEQATVSVFDHGFLYGDGVFEGIRAYEGRVFRLEDHVKRLFDSARAIMLNIPITEEQMCEVIKETLRMNNLKNAYIRPIVSRGYGDLGLDPNNCKTTTVVVIAVEWGAMYGDLYEKGLTAVSVCIRRNSPDSLPPNIKSLNYLNNILAKIEANVKGGNEAIILDSMGLLSEGSGDNIFIVKNQKIYTPHTINNLKGITREAVLDLAGVLDIEFAEKELGLFDIYTADEVFVTGTAAEVAPVTKVDGRSIGSGKPGPITKKLMGAFKELTLSTGTPVFR